MDGWTGGRVNFLIWFNTNNKILVNIWWEAEARGLELSFYCFSASTSGVKILCTMEAARFRDEALWTTEAAIFQMFALKMVKLHARSIFCVETKINGVLLVSIPGLWDQRWIRPRSSLVQHWVVCWCLGFCNINFLIKEISLKPRDGFFPQTPTQPFPTFN